MPTGRDPVSIVVPVWGAYDGAGLDAALASLRAQDVPVEIVLVDNASDPPVTRPGVAVVRSEERLTLGAARNLGLAAVRTPLLLFWDADDVMPPGALARLVDQIEGDPGLVACSATLIDGLTGQRHHWPRRWPLHLVRWPHAFAVANAVSSLYGVIGAVVRAEPVREAPFPDTDGGDDWVLAVSLAFRGRVAVQSEPARHYTRWDASVSSSWGRSEGNAHARFVRARLREDPAVPRWVRALLPAVALGHLVTLRVMRPVARRTPRRRRERL